jgi:hypothetical protein
LFAVPLQRGLLLIPPLAGVALATCLILAGALAVSAGFVIFGAVVVASGIALGWIAAKPLD